MIRFLSNGRTTLIVQDLTPTMDWRSKGRQFMLDNGEHVPVALRFRYKREGTDAFIMSYDFRAHQLHINTDLISMPELCEVINTLLADGGIFNAIMFQDRLKWLCVSQEAYQCAACRKVYRVTPKTTAPFCHKCGDRMRYHTMKWREWAACVFQE